MRKYERKPKRPSIKVKKDIENTRKIVREDIYDVLKETFKAGKTKKQAEQVIRKFVRSLNGINGYIKQHGRIEEVIRRIVSDIDSYGLNWEANEK